MCRMIGFGMLGIHESHPAAVDAMAWLKQRVDSPASAGVALGAFDTMAAEGSRLAEVCAGTLRAFIAGEPVIDRYLLGLCWTLRHMDEAEGGPQK
jgi:hypothetical protein